jgi:ribonucleoside-diphosphate reductase alpha chain
MEQDPFEIDISRLIWETRYQYRRDGEPLDATVRDSWRRVAGALASVESEQQPEWQARFYELLSDFRFLPGGRILAGCATGHDVTLFNCFVMGPIEDDMEAIFDNLKQGALTMQHGGGEGWDFSTLRPAGATAQRAGNIASGPVSFMRIWDSMCATLISTAFRRGAMMATLRCDHPDIEAFVDAKRDPHELRNFNLSVLVSDAFMGAVEAGRDWPLVFPADGLHQTERRDRPVVERVWSGGDDPVPCLVMKTLPARQLWRRIMAAAYDSAEPGVLFIDRINAENNLRYRERISATNPCGEIPLPPFGACDLGSLNLTRFVRQPFSDQARFDFDGLAEAATLATRILDNVISLSRFPLPRQAEQARGTRRIGLGITGLANALAMLGLHYGTEAARELAREIMALVCHSAYGCSVALARQKDPFPFFSAREYLQSPFIARLPGALRDAIRRHGIRNSHLIAIAPAGTISLFANNISSGIEPVFAFNFERQIRDAAGRSASHTVSDYGWRLWRRLHGDEALPGYFVTAMKLDPRHHLAMQAALQPYVDSAISKTINVPEDFDFEAFQTLYTEAYALGLKGCTAFRPTALTGAVLAELEAGAVTEPRARCCALDRESD